MTRLLIGLALCGALAAQDPVVKAQQTVTASAGAVVCQLDLLKASVKATCANEGAVIHSSESQYPFTGDFTFAVSATTTSVQSGKVTISWMLGKLGDPALNRLRVTATDGVKTAAYELP